MQEPETVVRCACRLMQEPESLRASLRFCQSLRESASPACKSQIVLEPQRVCIPCMQVSDFARVPQIQQVHFISYTPAKKRVVPTAAGHQVFCWEGALESLGVFSLCVLGGV